MKFKKGDTVYLEGKVIECIQSDFEIGFGYHSEEYIVKLNEVNGTIIFKHSLLLSKDEIKNDKLVPEIGKKYRYKSSPKMSAFTVVCITESSIFYEYGDNSVGFATDHEGFAKNCIPHIE